MDNPLGDLRHYASAPLTGSVETADQPPSGEGRTKPKGLWVSVGDAWEEWCRVNGFGPVGRMRDTWVYRVRLHPGARILTAGADPDDVLQLVEEYGVGLLPVAESVAHTLDWQRIAHEYDGMILTDYSYAPDLRLDPRCLWYYGWDCASGCLWGGAQAVEAVELLEMVPAAPPSRSA